MMKTEGSKFDFLTFNYKLLLFLILFFSIRILFSFTIGGEGIIQDGVSFNSYALAILNQPDWLIDPDFYGHYRPPVYPLFLAVIYYVFGLENIYMVYFMQAILSTMTVYYIYKLASSIFNKNEALLAFYWAGIYIFYIRFVGWIYRETLVTFLMIYLIYHLWLFFDRKNKVNFLKNIDIWKFIIAFILLLHTDARYLAYIPFLLILFVIYEGFYRGIKYCSVVFIILVLMIIPWTIRNYIAYEGFVLINTRTLDMTQNKASIRLELLNLKEINNVAESASFAKRFNKNYPSESERILIKRGENPNNRLDHEIQLIMNDVYPATSYINRKLYYLKRMLYPFRFWWDYSPFPMAKLNPPWSLRNHLITIPLYGTLIPFMFIGIFQLIKKNFKAVWILVIPIFLQVLIHFFTFGMLRYRIPIDAFIIILGCYGIQYTLKYAKKEELLINRFESGD